MSEIGDRDVHCVACDEARGPFNDHHRIHGNRADNRPSNLIRVCGSGTTGCHGVRIGGASSPHDPRRGRAWAMRLGYVISRHTRNRDITETSLVWYQQPTLGRVGWYQLTDDGGITGPIGLPPPDRKDLPA